MESKIKCFECASFLRERGEGANRDQSVLSDEPPGDPGPVKIPPVGETEGRRVTYATDAEMVAARTDLEWRIAAAVKGIGGAGY